MRQLIATRIDDDGGPNQEYRDLKPLEATKLEALRVDHAAQDLVFKKKRALQKELHKKGWGNTADFMSELFDKGFDTMKQEFDAVKAEVDSRF